MNRSSPEIARPEIARVAVAGTGSIGARHLSILAGMEGIEPIAVPVRVGRAAELEKLGYVTARDMDDAVSKGARLCIVATDTGRHVKDGLAALERGMDTLMEKPMATGAADARTLLSRAEETGRRLFVACVLRFSQSLNIFKERLIQVGPLHSVRIES